MVSRPVNPRARRMALMVASVPELTKRTSSIDGMSSVTRRASSRLELGGRAEATSRPRRRVDRRDDLRVRVAEDHRPPGADVVDEAAAVGGHDVRAGGLLEEDRLAADAAKCAHRRVDAARDVPQAS